MPMKPMNASIKISVTPTPVPCTLIHRDKDWLIRDTAGTEHFGECHFARREYAVNAAIRKGFNKFI